MDKQTKAFRLEGKRIRDLRLMQEMSTTILAEKTGVTAAYISQIERNLAEPSLSVLRKLAQALHVELLYLFADDTPADVKITSAETASFHTVAEAAARYRVLSPLQLKNGQKPEMSVMVVCLGGGESDYQEYVTHDYAEFVTVLSGIMEYHTEKKVYRLEEGDSFYLKPHIPHLLHNPGQEEAKLLAVLGNIHPNIYSEKHPSQG